MLITQCILPSALAWTKLFLSKIKAKVIQAISGHVQVVEIHLADHTPKAVILQQALCCERLSPGALRAAQGIGSIREKGCLGRGQGFSLLAVGLGCRKLSWDEGYKSCRYMVFWQNSGWICLGRCKVKRVRFFLLFCLEIIQSPQRLDRLTCFIPIKLNYNNIIILPAVRCIVYHCSRIK